MGWTRIKLFILIESKSCLCPQCWVGRWRTCCWWTSCQLIVDHLPFWLLVRQCQIGHARFVILSCFGLGWIQSICCWLSKLVLCLGDGDGVHYYAIIISKPTLGDVRFCYILVELIIISVSSYHRHGIYVPFSRDCWKYLPNLQIFYIAFLPPPGIFETFSLQGVFTLSVF